MPYARHVYHVYAIRVPSRDRVFQHLNASGIQAGIHYPIPVHLQPAYRTPDTRRGTFRLPSRSPRSDFLADLFPELTPAQIDEVCASVRSGLAGA